MVALPALVAMVLYQLTKGAVAVTLKPKLSLPAKAALPPSSRPMPPVARPSSGT